MATLFGAFKRFVSRNVKIRRMNERIWTDRIRTLVRSNPTSVFYEDHMQDMTSLKIVCVGGDRENGVIGWKSNWMSVIEAMLSFLMIINRVRVFVSSVVCFVTVRTEKLRFSWLWLLCHSWSMRESRISLRFEHWTQVRFLVFSAFTWSLSAAGLFKRIFCPPEEVLEQADYLYSCGETQKLHQLLVHHKDR